MVTASSFAEFSAKLTFISRGDRSKVAIDIHSEKAIPRPALKRTV
jgi:hypothetical protein